MTAADVLEAIVGDPTDTEAQSGGETGDGEGTLVMDGMMPVDELKSRLALPDLPAEGPIGLQHHGGPKGPDGNYTGIPALLQYRNIYIKELP